MPETDISAWRPHLSLLPTASRPRRTSERLARCSGRHVADGAQPGEVEEALVGERAADGVVEGDEEVVDEARRRQVEVRAVGVARSWG